MKKYTRSQIADLVILADKIEDVKTTIYNVVSRISHLSVLVPWGILEYSGAYEKNEDVRRIFLETYQVTIDLGRVIYEQLCIAVGKRGPTPPEEFPDLDEIRRTIPFKTVLDYLHPDHRVVMGNIIVDSYDESTKEANKGLYILDNLNRGNKLTRLGLVQAQDLLVESIDLLSESINKAEEFLETMKTTEEKTEKTGWEF